MRRLRKRTSGNALRRMRAESAAQCAGALMRSSRRPEKARSGQMDMGYCHSMAAGGYGVPQCRLHSARTRRSTSAAKYGTADQAALE